MPPLLQNLTGAFIRKSTKYWRSCGALIHPIESIRTVAVTCTVYIIVVLLPLYVILSTSYGLLTHEYAWAVSAGFLQNKVSVALFYVFWTILLGLFITVFCRVFPLNPTDGRNVQDDVAPVPTFVAPTQRTVIACIVFVVVNIGVVLGVNTTYVYVAIYQSNDLLLIAQISMSMFKLIWNNVCANWVLSSVVHYVAPLQVYVENEFAFLQQMVAVVNTIVIPCLVVATVNPDCFYNVFVPAPTITSEYQYEYCLYTGPGGNCDFYTHKPSTTTFNPPFTYNYQCSSSLITYYAPTFVIMCIISTFFGPPAQYLGLYFYKRATPGTLVYRALNFALPRLLKNTGGDTASPKSLKYRYFKPTRVLTQLITFLGLLLTFGAVFPPLAAALMVTILATVLLTKLKVGRFLSLARERELQQYVELVEKECQGVGAVSVLHNTVWILVTFSCWFYTLFLFDTLGDAVGFQRAYWVLIVMPLLPVIICVALNAAVTKDTCALLSRYRGPQTSGDDADFELSECGPSGAEAAGSIAVVKSPMQ